MPVIRDWRPRRVRWAAFALIAVLSAPAATARADDGSAVWVPLAPAGAPVSGPLVLVPFAQSIRPPEPGTGPRPWVPDYLSPRRHAAAPDSIVRRLRNLPRRDDFRLVGAGHDLSGQGPAVADAGEVPAAPGATLSEVLRDLQWRRDTAARMRAQPGFRPPY